MDYLCGIGYNWNYLFKIDILDISDILMSSNGCAKKIDVRNVDKLCFRRNQMDF